MWKTKTKLDDLLERYKYLDHVCANNRLEEYENLVYYYSTSHTKQHMENSRWMVPHFKKEMQKHLAAHMRDEKGYRKHLFTFKKTFPDFMYRSPDNSKPFNPIKEVGEVKYSGVRQEKQEEKP